MQEIVLFQAGQSVLVIAVALILVRLIKKGMRIIKDRDWLPPTFVVIGGNFLRWTVWVTMFLLVLEIFGLPLRTIWAGLLSIALIVAIAFFASWSVMSNILASMLLIAFSRIRVGDIVELRETKRDEVGMRGRLVDINLFFVTLQELAVEPDISAEPAMTQVPCHLFFFRVTRCWAGKRTQPLLEAFKDGNQKKESESAGPETPDARR